MDSAALIITADRSAIASRESSAMAGGLWMSTCGVGRTQRYLHRLCVCVFIAVCLVGTVGRFAAQPVVSLFTVTRDGLVCYTHT